jgi:large repetitive protein
MKKRYSSETSFYFNNEVELKKSKRNWSIFNLTTNRLVGLVFLCSMITSNLVYGQATISDYTFSTNTTSTLEDLSAGATVLLTGVNDDNATAVINFGFTFYFGGANYTQFSANSNGQIKLGTGAIGGGNVSAFAAGIPYLFAMSGDNECGNGIRYKVIGTSPNRKLVIEFVNFYGFYTDITNAGNMQVWLEETSGTITYVYGEIYNTSSATIARGIGLGWANSATTAGYVTVAATPTFTAGTLVTNTFAAGSGTTTGSPLIANLGSSSASARRAYIFRPTVHNLTFNTAGNATWVSPICPPSSVSVKVWGSGGGGGGAGGNPAGGGGGSGGGYSQSNLSVSSATTYNLTVGAAGAAGAAASGNGGNGNPSYFGNTTAGSSAGATVLAVGGNGGAGMATNTSSGAGGTAVTTGNIGTVMTYGGVGGTGATGATAGGGGGSGGTSAAGNPGTAGSGSGGAAAVTGGGAGGNAGNGGTAAVAGSTPGGGGGGGRATAAADRAGAAGGVGQVVISYTPQTTAATPVVSAICSGVTSVSGTSSEVNGSTVTVFKNGTSVGTTTVSSSAWTISGLTALVNGDVITANVKPDCKLLSATSTGVTVAGAVGGTASSDQSLCTGSTPADIVLTGYTGTIQWQISTDNSSFSAIGGATGATLTSAQMGALTATRYYRALLTSGSCTSLSNVATVTVGSATTPTVSIPASPSTTFCSGTSVTFTATGANMNGTSIANAEWFLNGSSVQNSASATYTSSSFTNGQTVSCIITTTAGCVSTTSATSATSTLTVSPSPVITGNPSNSSVVAGSTTTFVAASSTGSVTYQWQYATSAGGPWSSVANATPTGVTYTGATTNTLTVATGGSTPAGSSYFYRCEVTLGSCPVYTTAATMTVLVYCVPVGVTGYYISNATVTGGVTNFNNGTGGSAGGYGNYASTISCSQAAGSSVNFSLAETGGSAYFFCWIDWNQDSDFLDAGESIFGTSTYAATYSGSYTIPGGTPPGNYRMRFASSYIGAVTSCGPSSYGEYEDYTFTVCGAPAVPGTITGTATQCPNTASLTYSISAVSGATSYSWTVPTGWSITAGSGTTSITVTSGNVGQNGNISVSSVGACGTSAAQTFAVTVSGAVGGTASSSQSLCTGSTPSDIVLTGYTGTIQWQISTDNSSYSAIGGATGATLTSAQMGSLSVTTYYRALLTSGSCTALSTVATVTVGSATTPTVSIPASPSTTFCSGTSVTFTATGANLNGTSIANVEWFLNGSSVQNSASATYTSTSFTNGDAVYCVITTTAGCVTSTSATSPTSTLTVNPSPVITGNPSNATVIAGSSTTFVAASSTGSVTYQWQYATSAGGPWSSVTNATPTGVTYTGATTNTLTVATGGSTPAGSSYFYRCEVTLGSCPVYTTAAAMTVLVYCVPSGSTTYYISNATITGGITNFNNTTGASAGGYGNYASTISCSQAAGSSVSVSLTETGGSAYFYCWIDWNQDSDFLDAGESIFGTTSYLVTYTGSIAVPGGTPPGNYRMRFGHSYISAITSCGPAVNGEYEDYTFTVCAPPAVPGTISGTAAQCNNLTSQVYSIAAVSGATSYTWTVPTGWSVTAGAGTNSITVTTGNSGQNGNITVTATNTCGTSAAQTLAVTVLATPATPGTISGTASQCPALTTQTYSIAAVSGASSYTWTVPTGWTITAGATTNSITVTTGASGQDGNITVTATNYCGTSAAATLGVSVITVPSCISTFSPADAATNQSALGVIISWSAVAGATAYDVYVDGSLVSADQTGTSYTLSSVTVSTSYTWKVVPKNCAGSATGCSTYSFTTASTTCTPPSFTLTPTNILCFGASTGAIAVSASGGVSPYFYSIDNGITYQSGTSFSGLTQGTYDITVKGTDDCVSLPSSITLTQPASAVSSTASGSTSGCDGAVVALTGAGSGGTGALTYLWSPSTGVSNTAIASPSVTITGTVSYTLKVTDANGCFTNSSAVNITSNTPAAPTAGATPATICVGQSTNLNAVSTGNYINWWNAPTGGSSVVSALASGTNYAVSPVSTTTYYAEAYTATVGTLTTQTFNYTGSIVNWTVPADVTSITVDAKGAEGGIQIETNAFGPGKGARIVGTISVTPGQVLKVLVGGQPANAASDEGAGGGGGSFVATSANVPLVVAGGGGGEGADAAGVDASLTNNGTNANTGGAGGTSGNGGAIFTTGTSYGSGGAGFTGNGTGACTNGNGLSFINGGNGGIVCGGTGSAGGFGGAGGGSSEGGGGGGGYSGGGGADSGGSDGGGGGGSYCVVTPSTATASQTGNGQIIFTYTPVAIGCTSATRTAVNVTVGTYPTITVQPVTPAPICGSGTVTVSVTATSATSYQWMKGGVALVNDATYSNVTTNTLTITNPALTEDGAVLTCVVTGGSTCDVTSSSVILSVNSTPSDATSVTATSSTICVGETSQLSAISVGNVINWWDAATGGTIVSAANASGSNVAVTPVSTTTYYAESSTFTMSSTQTQTFNYTGSIVNWTVPAGVTSITVDAKGAEGGIQTEANAYSPGKGARIVGTISVTPGQVLKVLVGGQPANAATDEGAGGGGGSFVVTSANVPLVVAGGGGGEGADAAGVDASLTNNGANANTGGAGGTLGNGGAIFAAGTSYGSGGAGFIGNGTGSCTNGNGMSFLNGGNGGIVCGGTGSAGGFGGAGGGSAEGGGGGGGYSGGGGGDSGGLDGGGGGGSYCVVTPTTATATQMGNGQIVITYSAVIPLCPAAARVPVTVNVNAVPTITAQPASTPQSACLNVTPSALSVSATAGSGTIASYEWYSNTTASITGGTLVATNVSSALTDTYTPSTAVLGTLYYYVIVVNSNGCRLTSAVSGAVTVNPNPTAVTAASSLGTICNGATVNLTSSAVGNDAVSLNYTQGFESGLPSGWSIVQNGSGNLWTVTNAPSGAARTGTGVAEYYYNSTNAANTWLFTDAKTFYAGVTYTISFWEITGLFNERLKVTVGNAQTVASQTTTLVDYPGHQVTTYTQRTTTFTPTVTGTYYVALNAYSAQNRFYINIDDFSITGTYSPTPTYAWTATPAGYTSAVQNPTGVAPTVNTTYTVEATNTFNCKATNTVAVVVNQKPTSTITSSSSNLCYGNDYQLAGNITANGAWTLTLSNGATVTGTGSGTWNSTVVPPATTTYTVTDIVDALGCPVGTLTGSTVLTLPTATAALSPSDNATCIVKGTSWIHFYSATGKLIVSINPNGNDLGDVTATSYVDAGPVMTQACNTDVNPNYTSAALARRWVITPTTQPTTNVSVRFPFDDTEFSALSTASTGTANGFDDVFAIADLQMSKYNGTNENDSWSDNCGTGVSANFMQTTSGAVSGSSFVSTITGASFAEFSIPGFSEFWILNSGEPSALPVEMVSFAATCNEKEVEVKWTTASEHNSQDFMIETSRDLSNWITVGQVDAAGNSNQNIDYSILDGNPISGVSYYRMVLVDLDGVERIYGPISVSCSDTENSMIVFPNPTKGNFIVEISSSESISNAQIQITDLTGKVINERSTNILEGKSQFTFEGLDLQLGTYIINLKIGNGKINPVRVVVN